MSDITVYKPAALTVNVVDGNPPADQSAQVAALQAQVTALTAQVASLQTKIANAQAALA
jgi:cell division protein FtsB